MSCKRRVQLRNITDIIIKYKMYKVDLSEINHIIRYNKSYENVCTVNKIINVNNKTMKELSLNKKYLIEDLEELSNQVFKILTNENEFNKKYANQFGIDRKKEGFKTVDEIIHFASWIIENVNIEINEIENNIIKLELKESTLSYNELLERQKRKIYLIAGIHDNLFNKEIKEKYEMEYLNLVTIHSLLEELEEIHIKFKPLEKAFLEIN